MSQKPETGPRRKSKAGRWILIFSCLNLAALCCVSYVLYVVSESWWIGTILTYAPRTPYVVPTILLMLASLFWHRESLGINLVSLLTVLVPIMGLSLPLELWLSNSTSKSDESALRIISCNVQGFRPAFEKVLDEFAAIHPDVVALQEAFEDDPRLDKFFPDWHKVYHNHYWVGSRFPISLVSGIDVKQFGGRPAGVIVKIETPAGPVVLADVHQMTARWGLKELSTSTIVDGNGIKELEAFEGERYLESIEIRAAINEAREERPLIVCGDFNTPTSSTLFQKHWGDLQSSFELAGFGYGYTSPCKGNQFWPDNLPWARIDHILSSNDWAVRECRIGTSDGSDHRLITAMLLLKPEAQKNQ